jgi:MFS family permease
MATGMAIMGFGGGAMIGAPLANLLIQHYRSATDVGVAPTFLTLAAIYFVFMCGGAFLYRVPPEGWRPQGWEPPARSHARIASASVLLRDAHRTPQFWLLWAVLCLNVSAGISVLDMASPMLQEIFGGRLIGHPELGFTALSPEQRKAVAAIAAGFAGFLSLFNIVGRFFWASLSDRIGRRATYSTFFLLGMVLYALVPSLAAMGSRPLFALAMGVILSMYGGGFATIPAYLADLFGTRFVGAIHGRLLTAWSAAGVIGPFLINTLRDAQIAAGVPRANVYDRTMYVLAGLLLLGLVCNLMIQPLDRRWFRAEAGPVAAEGAAPRVEGPRGGLTPGALLPWLAVGIPLAWGFYQTIVKAAKLFT